MARRKSKRFDGESGSLVSLEEQYPGAKITRLPPGEPPKEGDPGSEKHIRNLQALRKKYGQEPSVSGMNEKVGKIDARPEYEQKTEKFEGGRPRIGGGGGRGGASGDYMPLDKMLKARKMFYKSGGSVSSASKRADGCAVKGKTKGRIV